MNKRSWLIIADVAGLLGCLILLAVYPDAMAKVHDLVVGVIGAFAAGLAAAHAYVYRIDEEK